MKRKKIGVKDTVNCAIRFVKSYPCAICAYEHPTEHTCMAGVKYRGTCKVARHLRTELWKLREMEGE